MNDHSHASGRLIAGILLILLGALFTLDSFGILRAGDLFAYWPLILIGAGLAKIFGIRRPEQRVGGVLLLLIGSLFLLRTLDLIWFRVRDLWPFVLLFVGGALLWQALRRRGQVPGGSQTPGERGPEGGSAGLGDSAPWRSGPTEVGATLNEFALMGGGDRVVRSQEFRGGEVTAIMGGFKIDLRGATIAGDSATVETFTVWGGVEFRVPDDWNVAMHGTPILGVFTNSTRPLEGQTPRKTLIIRGTAIMGGVEVKN